MCIYVFSHSVVSNTVTPWTVACQASLTMRFSSKKTEVGCHFLLQGIFPTQGLNLHLLCLLQCHQGSSYLKHIIKTKL